MAEATAADGQMKDLSISETKKSKKDGNPQKAAKKPQQQKKKVSCPIGTAFEVFALLTVQ
jgi:prolyl-tRNA synthetase